MNIIVCLPGRNFSGEFLKCWTEFINRCNQKKYNILLSQKYSCNIYYVRNMCLGADVLRGTNQKPYNGKVKYDYLLWIDSDIIFNFDAFEKLLKHQLDIVSGLYYMENGTQFATVKDWDEEYFKRNGSFYFLTKKDIENETKPFEVSYTGFGFMLIKYGVFESLNYPWFRPIYQHMNNNTIVDFTMEDVAFCLDVKEQGYKIMVDPNVIVGHEKTKVLI